MSSTRSSYRLASAVMTATFGKQIDGRSRSQMILAYHEIVPGVESYRYAVACSVLNEHLALITKLATENRTPAPASRVTFDDGHLSNYRFAAPLLEKHGIRGTFFVIGSNISNKPNYMTWEELRQLVFRGHEVQSHGWSHVPLNQCSENQLKEELVRSKKTLEDKLGISVESLSAAHGRWNDHVLEACAKAGYKQVFHSDPWAKPCERAGIRLAGRLIVDRKMDANKLRRLVEQEWGAMFLLGLRRHLKDGLKNTLGDPLYHKLWCQMSGWTGPVEVPGDEDTSPQQGS